MYLLNGNFIFYAAEAIIDPSNHKCAAEIACVLLNKFSSVPADHLGMRPSYSGGITDELVQRIKTLPTSPI